VARRECGDPTPPQRQGHTAVEQLRAFIAALFDGARAASVAVPTPPQPPQQLTPPTLAVPVCFFIIEACAAFAAYALGAAPGAWLRYTALGLALLPATALEGAIGSKFTGPIRRGLGLGACLWLVPARAVLAGYVALYVLLRHALMYLLGGWIAEDPEIDAAHAADCVAHAQTMGRHLLGAVFLLVALTTPWALRVSYFVALQSVGKLLSAKGFMNRVTSQLVDFMHKAHRTLRPVRRWTA